MTREEAIALLYETPIEMYVRDFHETMIRQENDSIVAEISKTLGFHIERDELIKALEYDREQYRKGYSDALNSMILPWIPVSDRLPEESGRYLTTCECSSGRYVNIQVWDDGWGDCADCVVAWIALPEYYTGDLEYWLREEEE